MCFFLGQQFTAFTVVKKKVDHLPFCNLSENNTPLFTCRDVTAEASNRKAQDPTKPMLHPPILH